MSKPKPTPEEILNKKKRDTLRSLCNRISSAWNFKQIKSWEDVYKFTGVPKNGASTLPLTYPELLAYLKGLQNELEEHIKKEALNNTSIGGADIGIEQPKESSPSTISIARQPTTQEIVKPVVSETKQSTTDESGISNTNDYGLHPSDKEKAFLFWFQKKATKQMWDAIVVHNNLSVLLLASTGTGKTYMAGALVRRLFDANFHVGKTFGHVKYLYVTRATIVEQTKRVFHTFFDLGIKDGVEILNIEQLRSRAGQLWLTEEEIVENGQDKIVWKWKPFMQPAVIIWDECQALKNEGSTQHQIAASLNDVKPPVVQVFVSATPFTRVYEAKCFAVATHKDITDKLGIGNAMTLSNELWPTYSSAIAYPSKPDEYNEAAVERLTKDLEPFIVRVKGVRPQFEAINKVKMISFATKEEHDYYHAAWERYLEEKAKLEIAQLSGGQASGLQILVQFLKFRMAAELCRAPYLAKAMHEAVLSGKAACCALNFKATIIKIVQILVNEYGIPRDKISLVWGGGQTALTKKQKDKKIIMANLDKLREAGIDVAHTMEALDLVDVEERELEQLNPALRLGMQSKDERQHEIDRFQSGRSLYCLYTFKSGGVGLSLHHTDELSRVKARRQKNGYVVVEDIPNVPIRPRVNFVAPTYSAIELVQGLGRCPRLTSLSDTEQTLVFYSGTIEQEVAHIVSAKLRCLSRVVRMKESWEDVCLGGVSAESHIDINAVPDEDGNLDGADEAEET